METQTYQILACNLVVLEEKFKKLEKKAKRLGLKTPTFEVKRYIPEVKQDPILRAIEGVNDIPAKYEIELHGEFPKLAGWDLVGTVEHTEFGNILRTIPGRSMNPAYREQAPTCDHCETSRARKETFVVINTDSQEIKRVGRSCLKDYLGSSLERIVYSAMILRTFSELEDEEYQSGGTRASGMEIVEYLAKCVAVIRTEGYYLSKTKAQVSGGMPTSEVASQELFASPKDVTIETLPEDRTEALRLLNWISSAPANSEYEQNLKIISKMFLIQAKHRGYVASIPAHYRRQEEREEQQKVELKEKAKSEYFGTEGKRENFKLTLDKKFFFDTEFGRMAIYKFKDESGNTAVWKTGSYASIEDGETVEVRATVKEHKEYRSEKQTVLSRLSVVESAEMAAS